MAQGIPFWKPGMLLHVMGTTDQQRAVQTAKQLAGCLVSPRLSPFPTRNRGHSARPHILQSLFLFQSCEWRQSVENLTSTLNCLAAEVTVTCGIVPIGKYLKKKVYVFYSLLFTVKICSFVHSIQWTFVHSLGTEHSKSERKSLRRLGKDLCLDHCIWSHHFTANRWGNSDRLFWGLQKYWWWLQMVTAAMKLKDAYSLEGKLWPT